MNILYNNASTFPSHLKYSKLKSMKQEDDRPVTHAYLKEVLVRVDESLQEYSRAIAGLQKRPQNGQSYMNTNRLAQVEEHIAQLRQDVQSTTQEEQRDDSNQGSLQQKVRELETRLEQCERLEKSEEYDQNTLEKDFRQHEREYDLLERRIRDIEYKLKRL